MLANNSVLIKDGHIEVPRLDKEAPDEVFLPVSTGLRDGLEVAVKGILAKVTKIVVNPRGIYWALMFASLDSSVRFVA